MRLKTVIHVHTDYSHDSNRSWEEVLHLARRQRVDVVAITDHNTIAGALAARDATDAVRVIVGEEISSADGHLIGLFLDERVPPQLTGEETVARIRAQGGLVLAPHPLATLCASSLGRANLERLTPLIDAVEVCNAQNPFAWEDRRAARYADRCGIVGYAGADAHLRGYLAGCYQLMADFASPGEFLAALRGAELVRGHFGPAYTARMAARHYWAKLSGRRWRGFGVRAGEMALPQV